MTQFSANLGFLWSDLPLPDAIRAAAKAGFAAVECHWPCSFDAAEVKAALQDTGLPMLGLNTARGDVAGGENGLSALPGREADARAAIDEAAAYAEAVATGPRDRRASGRSRSGIPCPRWRPRRRSARTAPARSDRNRHGPGARHQASFGWSGLALGAEYKPTCPVEQTLGWMTELSRRRVGSNA